MIPGVARPWQLSLCCTRFVEGQPYAFRHNAGVVWNPSLLGHRQTVLAPTTFAPAGQGAPLPYHGDVPKPQTSRLTASPPPGGGAGVDERTTIDVDLEELVDLDTPWQVIVWNDPINLMSYVTLVFQKLFGYSKEKATLLMLDVHQKGRAIVAHGNREKAELDVFRLHEHGLWATMEKSTGGGEGGAPNTGGGSS